MCIECIWGIRGRGITDSRIVSRSLIGELNWIWNGQWYHDPDSRRLAEPCMGGSVEFSSSLSLHLLFMRPVDGFAPINSLCRHRTCHVALAMKVENQMYVPCTLSSWPNYRRRETQTRWAGFVNMIEIFLSKCWTDFEHMKMHWRAHLQRLYAYMRRYRVGVIGHDPIRRTDKHRLDHRCLVWPRKVVQLPRWWIVYQTAEWF